MFENNQVKYDRLKNAVQKYWGISDEEFGRTQGHIDELVHLITAKSHEPETEVREKLQQSVLKANDEIPFTEKPPGIVNSANPDSEEWHAREDQQH